MAKKGEMYIGTAISIVVSVIVGAIVYLSCVQYVLPQYCRNEADKTTSGYASLAEGSSVEISNDNIVDKI